MPKKQPQKRRPPGGPPLMWELSTDLEQEWLDKFRNDGACAVLCGVRGAGKSLMALSFIRTCMERRIYDTYWCVIPAYQYEQKNSYGWMDEMVKQSGCKCTVFSAFSDEVAEHIIEQQLRDQKKKSILFLDDASSMRRLFQRSGDVRDPLNAILTQSRHLRISSMICLHSLKSTIHPTIRMNCTFLVLFDIGSKKLLEHVHEEFTSLVCPSFDDFLEMFMFHLRSRTWGCICFSTSREKNHDVDCLDWPIIAKSRDKILAHIKENANSNRVPAPPRREQDDDDE